jgi:hypothetical protein
MKNWLRAHSHQGYLTWERRIKKQVRRKIDDGMASAEISVICGNNPLNFS